MEVSEKRQIKSSAAKPIGSFNGFQKESRYLDNHYTPSFPQSQEIFGKKTETVSTSCVADLSGKAEQPVRTPHRAKQPNAPSRRTDARKESSVAPARAVQRGADDSYTGAERHAPLINAHRRAEYATGVGARAAEPNDPTPEQRIRAQPRATPCRGCARSPMLPSPRASAA